MTDEQVEKYLATCPSDAEGHNCAECPYRKTPGCFDHLVKDASELLNKKNAKIKELENLVVINKGAMRAYREAFEKAHDEAVKDFSYFLIDKAKDGCIEICDLPDLIAEWSSPSRRESELMTDVNVVFDEAAESVESSTPLIKGSITGKSFYEARFEIAD